LEHELGLFESPVSYLCQSPLAITELALEDLLSRTFPLGYLYTKNRMIVETSSVKTRSRFYEIKNCWKTWPRSSEYWILS